MVSVGLEIKFAWIHLILESKFEDSPVKGSRIHSFNCKLVPIRMLWKEWEIFGVRDCLHILLLILNEL